MSRPRSGPTIAQRVVAADLRARREAAGLTLDAAADALGVHRDTVRRLEDAVTSLRPATVARLLSIYRTPPREADAVLAQLTEANRPGWWHEYRDILPTRLAGVIDLEEAAVLVRTYAPGVVPDLLRTPDYARALLRLSYPSDSEERIERRVELLAERQRRAFERDRPLRMWALLDEAAIHRTVGGPEVMADQRAHLEKIIAQVQHIRLQVLRADGPVHHLTDSGPVDVLRLAHPALRDRLILCGLRADTTIITDDVDTVRTYQAAMDSAAVLAPPPDTPLPPARASLWSTDE
jgi:transcriptional regulator with XRE-family HTH domain